MPKYIDLIEKLTKEDKEKLNLYITKYGCPAKEFIGLDKWLQDWSHANQKLYKLLGNSFIKEYPYEYEKQKDLVEKEIKESLFNSDFKNNYHHFYWNYIKEMDYPVGVISFFNHLTDAENFINGTVGIGLKMKKPNGKKMLQIQPGTKILKAIGRVIEYFKEDFDFDIPAFENFKKQYAIITSEKIIKGKYCISILPLDFITMSDNDANWTSCMNWTAENGGGCYHVGTIEMMNSNNVVCVYLLNDDSSFVFDKETIDENTGELKGTWNNKRWRQLFYVNKDIIMGGKAYPYVHKELTLSILESLRELAKNSFNWTYQFGPELYQDMIHVKNQDRMEKQREWMHIEKKKPVKHNIIWDTKGMYNDMLNASDYKYWCIRNKVNHTKIISVSGKAPCLCCGGSILTENEYGEDYNDRYDNTGSAVCNNCLDTKFRCDACGDTIPNAIFIDLPNGQHVCQHCIKYVKICPCCNQIYYTYYQPSRVLVDVYYNPELYYQLKNNETLSKKVFYRIIYPYDYSKTGLDEKLTDIRTDEDGDYYYPLEQLYFHDCLIDKEADIINNHCLRMEFNRTWWRDKKEIFYIIDPVYAEKYRFYNLETPSKIPNLAQ